MKSITSDSKLHNSVFVADETGAEFKQHIQDRVSLSYNRGRTAPIAKLYPKLLSHIKERAKSESFCLNPIRASKMGRG